MVLAAVRSQGRAAPGKVTVSVDGAVVATRNLVLGAALVVLPRDLAVGSHQVTVSYLGSATTAPSSTIATLTVRTARGRH